MRAITLEAETPESGRALYSALSSFHPGYEVDDAGTCFVSVSFAGPEEMLDVFDAIQQHLGGRRDLQRISETTRTPLRLVAPDA